MNDGSACVLAEGQHALGCHVGIAQELEGDILVVLACLGVGQHLGNLQVVFAAQHELHIVETLLGQQGQRLLADL